MDGWMDGWMDGQTDRKKDRQLENRMNALVGLQMDQQANCADEKTNTDFVQALTVNATIVT